MQTTIIKNNQYTLFVCKKFIIEVWVTFWRDRMRAIKVMKTLIKLGKGSVLSTFEASRVDGRRQQQQKYLIIIKFSHNYWPALLVQIIARKALDASHLHLLTMALAGLSGKRRNKWNTRDDDNNWSDRNPVGWWIVAMVDCITVNQCGCNLFQVEYHHEWWRWWGERGYFNCID